MADILLDNQVVPATPAAGKTNLYVNSTSKLIQTKDDAGKINTLGGLIVNFNTADVTANAADTYLTGSGITIPTGMTMQLGTMFRWIIYMTKTAAGVAAPVWRVRVGTAGTTADTARLTFTQVALQTAAVDAGIVEITAIMRGPLGASGILAGGLLMTHVLAITGFSTLGDNVMQVTSGAFDTTVAGTIVGVSVDPGAAGVWTHQVITAECMNI